jgi:hypothetical protein
VFGLPVAGKIVRAGLVTALAVSAGWAGVIPGITPARAGSTAAGPAGRERASFAYDPALHEVVLFGGDNGRVVLGDTWVHLHRGWVRQHPVHSPSPRTGAAMVYDAATGQLLLFGGSAATGAGGGFFAGTWEWTGRDWRKLHPADSPAARRDGDLIYDAATQTVVMFGGYDGSYLGDTWIWDGGTWNVHLEPPEPVDGGPSPRDGGSFTFDAATGTGVLFGGFDGVNRFTGTWTWTGGPGSEGSWALQQPATSPPDSAFGWMAAYDAITQRVLLFGQASARTWAWNGVTWTSLAPAASPPGRNSGTMTDNTATSRTLLFGGRARHGAVNDLWSWDGATWQRNH